MCDMVKVNSNFIGEVMEHPDDLAWFLYMYGNTFEYYPMESFDSIIQERFTSAADLFKLGLTSGLDNVSMDNEFFRFIEDGHRIETFNGEDLYDYIAEENVRKAIEYKFEYNSYEFFLDWMNLFDGDDDKIRRNFIRYNFTVQWDKYGIKATFRACDYEKAYAFIELVMDIRRNGKGVNRDNIEKLASELFIDWKIDWSDIYVE